QKDNIHTQIKPEQNQNNRRETSIHVCKSRKNIQINRKNKRYKQPSAGGKNCSRKLSAQSSLCPVFSVWKEFIHKIPEYCQHNKCHEGPDPDNKVYHFAQKRHIFIQHHTDTVSKYRQNQG